MYGYLGAVWANADSGGPHFKEEITAIVTKQKFYSPNFGIEEWH